jgi:hypothetical protein
MATISKGITLGYDVSGSAAFILLDNLMEIPELGGDVESIEITTLADSAHMYTDGIRNYGDSLTFKFLYEQEQFQTLNNLKADGGVMWEVRLPQGESCTFFGNCSVKLDGVGVNAALTYTLSIKPCSAMDWA